MKARWGIIVFCVGAALTAYIWVRYKLPHSGPNTRPDPDFLPGLLFLLGCAVLIAGVILIIISLGLSYSNRHPRTQKLYGRI